MSFSHKDVGKMYMSSPLWLVRRRCPIAWKWSIDTMPLWHLASGEDFTLFYQHFLARNSNDKKSAILHVTRISSIMINVCYCSSAISKVYIS